MLAIRGFNESCCQAIVVILFFDNSGVNSRLLDYFLRVVELGSINRAAHDLHLSQPALSRHIAALEHEMGTALFNRSKGGVTLTDAGRLLSDRARPLLAAFSLLKDQLGQTQGQLAIGIPPSWQQVFTCPFVERMLTDSPGVSLRVHEGVSHVLREHMQAGLLDLCVIPFSTTPAAGYLQTALVREPLVLVGPAHTGLIPQEPVALQRLDPLPLVLPGRPNSIRALVENSLARLGLRFRLALQVDTLELCLEVAERGLAHTVVPACALVGLAPHRTVSWAPIRGFFLTWALNENKARSHSPAVREGRRVALAAVERALASRQWLGAQPTGRALAHDTVVGVNATP